ncbi:MAG: phenylacetate--CoA ligase [Clostridia bacterium]|nr:phenylacetate--CoA ligase [Clostridia bacterium]
MSNYYQPDIETASREEIEKLQSERLVKAVKRVYEKVPIYRERMDEAGVKPEDIKGIEDLYKLPFTSKQDLRDTYPYGMFAVPMEEVARLHASSGTTGKQIVVGYTQNDLDIWGDIVARQLVAAGITKKDKVHVAYGYGLFTGGLGIAEGSRRLGCTSIPVSSGNTARQLTIMQDFLSDAIACTPSYAMYLGESAAKAGIDTSKLPLRAGIFGAEPWTEEMRKEIEKSLNIKAYDIYGLTEIMGPGVAYECSEQRGMHVNEDHFIIEILDPETHKPVPDGEKGEIVFTCLTKEAFPLIRFRTKDIGTVTHEKCACGRTFVRMSKPMGRIDDMLIIRGVNVFPSQIETVLLQMNLSPNYQIIVDRKGVLDTIEVQVEMTEDTFSDTISDISRYERELADRLKSVLGIAAKATFVSAGSIARSEGKAKRVIDRRNLV